MQVVGQAGLIPCVAAKEVWRKKLRGRLVMNYVDNEAAKYAFIKGSSPTKDSVWSVQQFWEREANLECYTWFERVPSACNTADHPSREIMVVALGGKNST